VKNRNLKELKLLHEARPYIDRIFDRWRVTEESGDTEGESLVVEGSEGMISLSHHLREGSEVWFAPNASYFPHRAWSVSYLRWVIEGRTQPDDLTEQLRWLDIHSRWRTRWFKTEAVEHLRKLDTRAEDLSLDVEMYWGLDAPPEIALNGINRETRSIEIPSNLLDNEVISELYLRAIPLLRVLVPTGRASVVNESESGQSGLVFENIELAVRIVGGSGRDDVYVAPGNLGPNREWFDISRICRVLDRSECGSTAESKLFFIVCHRSAFEKICAPSNFEAFLFRFERLEHAFDDFRKALIA
jgi:hypothetical protein